MRSIQILDCTLRDGGYINDWKFGEKTIGAIIDKLSRSDIDIIECGFFSEKAGDADESLFPSAESVNRFIRPIEHKAFLYVAMIAIGEKEMDPAKLEDAAPDGIGGVRLTFHKNEVEKAVNWAKVLKSKGYKVFMQPVGTISYTEQELIELIRKVNALNPFAFYIVDTLGCMTKEKTKELFEISDKYLDPDICIGFHSHNNMQMAYSNSEELIQCRGDRNIILDSSVYGMGRGAGNLPTELIADYLDKNCGGKYDVVQILDIYDRYISIIRREKKWGYSMPYYIAARNECHPNYASFLINKQTLTMRDIEYMISMIPMEERLIFNREVINRVYMKYQTKDMIDTLYVRELIDVLGDKPVLVLAPGKSLVSESEAIRAYIEKEKPFVISINFLDNLLPLDACFVSNSKRLDDITANAEKYPETKIIHTSNLRMDVKNEVYRFSYKSLNNADELLFDNAGLMLLKLLGICEAKQIVLAGFDGFSTRYSDNYFDQSLTWEEEEEDLLEKQNHFKQVLAKFRKTQNISFLTKSVYEEDENV